MGRSYGSSPRYLDVAEDAHKEIIATLAIIAEVYPIQAKTVSEIAVKLGRIYNLGIKTAPRPVMGTVRERAVKAALKGLPVQVKMVKKTDERTGNTYNALHIDPEI